MLDGNEETPTDKTQALIWEDLVEVLAPQREKELQGKTPKAYNARWKHFSFRRNYYNKMLSLEDDQAKEYLQAICELAFNGKQPKELLNCKDLPPNARNKKPNRPLPLTTASGRNNRGRLIKATS